MRTLSIITYGNFTKVIGTTQAQGGIFCQREDGTWSRWVSEEQTPVFSDPPHLMRYLRSRFYPDTSCRMVRGSAKGWV